MRELSRRQRSFALVTSLALTNLTLERGALAGPPASEPATPDEVRLTNGGFVRGEIIELMPGEYVIIETIAGEPRRFEWSQVAEIVRGTTSTPGGVPGGVPSEPTPSEPAQIEPAPAQPQPAIDEPPIEGPTPDEPYVHIDVAGKHPMTLYRVLGRSVASSGGYTASGVAFKRVCQAPCDLQLTEPNAEFFLAGDKYTGSKPFYLTPSSSVFELRVKPRSKGMLIGGYVLMVSGIVFAGFMVAGPFLVNMRRSQANACFALAAVGGAGMIAGGVTMMAFGRSKVEVLPRQPSWLESH